MTSSRTLQATAIVLLLCSLAFMTLGAQGSWSFVLAFRGVKWLALVLVATAIGVSTVLFATITNNRILTPSLMGFDALYLVITTLLTFVLGSASAVAVDAKLLYMRHALEMMKTLKILADERNKTVVVVLHDINFASVYSDRIVAMKDGRLHFEGPPKEIMTPEALKALYDFDIAIEQFGPHRLANFYI